MKLVKQTHEVKINFLDKEYTTDIHETDDGYFIGNCFFVKVKIYKKLLNN